MYKRRDPYEERQVRLTAQRILGDNLRYQDPPARYWWHRSADLATRHWRGIRLDLTGATLIELRLSGCRISEAAFVGATFIGAAGFDAAAFDGATFDGAAKFDGATFKGDTRFDGATFDGAAGFGRAAFDGETRFGGATFNGNARFDEATGLERAGLGGVRVAPAAESVERVWPSCWQVEAMAEGWQTLRLTLAADSGGERGGGQ